MAILPGSNRRGSPAPRPDDIPPVAIIEEDAVVLSRLMSILRAHGGATPYSNLDELIDSGAPEQADGLVLVLGPSQMDEDVLGRTSVLLRADRAVGALVVVDGVDASALRIVLRAGLDDAVDLSLADEELPQSVRELGFRLRSVQLAKAAPSDSIAEPNRRGRITTVFSPKGGVGKTVVAVNLATALAQRATGTVALVDLNVHFGDVAVMLRMQPDHHIGDAANAADRLDAVLLQSLLTRDERSRLVVLAAPPGSSDGNKVTAQTVSVIFEVLRSIADHIVVDTAPGMDDTLLQVLSESEDIVYIVGMDVPSIKNARIGLQALELMSIPLERVIVVLNRADSKVHLNHRDVEKTLQMKVDASLPSDALVPQSVNTGSPAVLEYERSRFAGRVREIAAMVTDRAGADAQ